MKIFSKKIVAALIVALIASQTSFVCALEKEWKAEELSEDQQKAFITRDEFTSWVTAFTASLSEVDKNATQKIFDNMDFYDLQYKITILYDFDETNGKWYSESGIERPEGIYKPRTVTGTPDQQKEHLKNQLISGSNSVTNDATAWEKYRRGLITTPPYSSPAQQETDHGSSGTKKGDDDYIFTAK